MNRLTRKISSKSLSERESRGRGEGQHAIAADRAQSESKPSLLNRLRRSSRSRERQDQKAVDASVSPEARKPPAETVAENVSSSKAAEVPPTSTHDAPEQKHSTELEASDPATRKQISSTPSDPCGAVQERSEPAQQHKSHHKKDGLTKEDVEQLFSGAPQFVLEKGRRGRYFPQAFFPWNNDLETSDLQDRRYIKHESFALATLHAHLPIPDEVNWKPGLTAPTKREGLDIGKRPMFELGIFERPNMLGLEGREPGTVGMRYFLERPVADGVADENAKEHGKDVEIEMAIANAPAMEAFKMLALSKENDELNAKIGKHAPAVERARLIREGPHSWKAVGVREISIETLADRMDTISMLRDQVLVAGWRETVLNHMDSAELYTHLFTQLLYPPRKVPTGAKHEKASLKIQIEALVKVLTTPGAWLDLSAPEARLRFGKILHSRSTRYDGATGSFIIDPERKWLLIQLLLSVELVIRLDAALRLGVALHAENFEVSSEEIHHFNKLRNLKVDWDLVAARRYLFLSYVKRTEKKGPASVPPSEQHERPPTSRQPSSAAHEHHHGGLFGGLKHAMGLDTAAESATPHHALDTCDVVVMPRQAAVMVDGLVRFANNVGWPRTEELHESLRQKLCTSNAEDRERLLMDAIMCSDDSALEPKPDNLTGSLASFTVDLHPATPSTVGGWLSHSWLSGLIVPGTSICDILISTLLENDTDPQTLRDLGSTSVPLRGSGFILNGSSWWTKSSIVGRVMAPMRGAKESMGWVSTPNFVPLDEHTSQPVSNRWVKIKSFPVPTDRAKPRIFDGDKLAEDSTPLGKGKGAIMASEFSMVTDHVFDNVPTSEVRVKDIKIHLSSSDLTQASADHPFSAWAQFDLALTQPSPTQDDPVAASTTKQVRYGLDRAVYFVTAHPCRLPHGHATFKPGTLDFEHEQQHPHHKPGVAEHIPAHPLHKTFKFVVKSLADLVQNPTVEPPNPTNHDDPVWIVDARGHGSAGGGHGHPPLSSNPSTTSTLTTAATTTTSEGAASGTNTDTDAGIGVAISSPTVNNKDTPNSATNDPANLEKWLYESTDPQLWEKDILVRAWCAEKGRNAIIARSGRTCLSCAIREARALEVAIVVRVGIRERPSASE
ncbi:hypothetical protein G647_05093 [Cladophialophora carrionii CBS 160.54]|uniref:Uncharacterized protein n=1 Tax=Cladophialophora carrionii CBS 160.54 TaxID=1279043 RepID=V9DAE9_9EURO|nr:uncharacterized protein G647_05093 [Cladophialophora carrionii CBS 160.54]ETI23293.1 hypothetical protein G647_05093 [Cladophialophora carrionii CBS 160.54]